MPIDHNAPLPTTEHAPTTHELVQFRDPETPSMGEFAVLFNTPGENIELGKDADFKYAKHLGTGGTDFAIIKTKSGNAYGIGAGVIVNNNKRTAYKLPAELPPIPLGQVWELEGVGSTSEVESALFRRGGKRSVLGDDGARVINAPTPFKDLLRELEHARAQLYPGEHFPSLSWY